MFIEISYLENLTNEMVYTIRPGLFEIIRIQTIATLVIFVAQSAQ